MPEATIFAPVDLMAELLASLHPTVPLDPVPLLLETCALLADAAAANAEKNQELGSRAGAQVALAEASAARLTAARIAAAIRALATPPDGASDASPR